MSSSYGRSKALLHDHRQRQATAFLSQAPEEFVASQNTADFKKLPNFRKTSVVDAEKATGKKSASTSAQIGWFGKKESSAPQNAQRDEDSQKNASQQPNRSGNSTATSKTESRPKKRVEASHSESENSDEELPDLPRRKSPAKAGKLGNKNRQSSKASCKDLDNPSESEDEFVLVDHGNSPIPGCEVMFSSQESVHRYANAIHGPQLLFD